MNFTDYIFARRRVVDPNSLLYMDNTSMYIQTKEQFATYANVPVEYITELVVDGDDIIVKINTPFTIGNMADHTYKNQMTLWNDPGGKVDFYLRVFDRSYAPFAMQFISNIVALTTGQNFSSSNWRMIYIPKCTNLGGNPGDNSTFSGATDLRVVVCHPSLATNNNGGRDGDIAYAEDVLGAQIIYGEDPSLFIHPNEVSDLTAGNIYSTSVELNFTTPTSRNPVDYYKVFVNGVYYQQLQKPGSHVRGLNPNTPYEIKLISVDIFEQESEFSNVINITTNNQLFAPDGTPVNGLVNYFKLDETTGEMNDAWTSGYGTNNGAIRGVPGRIGNAYQYDGTSNVYSTIYFNPKSNRRGQINLVGDVSHTFMAWIYIDGLRPSRSGILGENGRYHWLLNSNGTLQLGRWGGGSVITGVAPINQWFLLTTTFDKPTRIQKAFINDSESASGTTSSAFNLSGFLTLGDAVPNELNFKGFIDQLRCYDVAVPLSQISSVYNTEKPI